MRQVAKAQWWLLVGLLLCVPFVHARNDGSRVAAPVPFIAISELPAEARETLQLIEHGGPFPYPRDGVVFGNYERILPQQPRGYYHEYTVKTSGVRHRGARRIVCGIVPEGSVEKSSELDDAQGARSGTAETYHEGRRGSEHRADNSTSGLPDSGLRTFGATQRIARAAILSTLPECYYTADHYRSFKRIKEEAR